MSLPLNHLSYFTPNLTYAQGDKVRAFFLLTLKLSCLLQPLRHRFTTFLATTQLIERRSTAKLSAVPEHCTLIQIFEIRSTTHLTSTLR